MDAPIFNVGNCKINDRKHMNIHAPSEDIREQFRCLEWTGRRWTKDGKTYIRAKHRTTHQVFYYCFEDNFAWFPTDVR